MTDKKYKDLKREAQSLRSIAEYMLVTSEKLCEMLESLNPSNPVRKRKEPTLAELTQIELQNIINNPKRK